MNRNENIVSFFENYGLKYVENYSGSYIFSTYNNNNIELIDKSFNIGELIFLCNFITSYGDSTQYFTLIFDIKLGTRYLEIPIARSYNKYILDIKKINLDNYQDDIWFDDDDDNIMCQKWYYILETLLHIFGAKSKIPKIKNSNF